MGSLFDFILQSIQKAALCLSVLLLLSIYATGQNQSLADSLESVYTSGKFKSGDELLLLKEIAESHHETDKKLSFSKKLIDLATQNDSNTYLYSGYLQKGNALRLKGDHVEALESYYQGATIARAQKLNRELGLIEIAIGDIYSLTNDHDNAVSNYLSAIKLLSSENDSEGLGSALLNIGDEYFNAGKLDSALVFFEDAKQIFNELDYELGEAYVLGNIGLVYASRGQNKIAEEKINTAIELLEKHGDFYPICVYLTYMSDIYMEKGQEEEALEFAYRSLELAKQYKLKDQVSEANYKLSEMFETKSDYKSSLVHFQQYVMYKDSVNNISNVQQIANLKTEHEVAQKQIEVDLLYHQKRNQQILAILSMLAFILITALAVALFKRNRFIQKTNQLIENERIRSENLLLNILPEETANELKKYGKVKAKKFEAVTVLFTDFIGFSKYSEDLTPEELVKIVDYYYSKFDDIMEKYNLEKIKTIGDAYMCAGGLPFQTDDHAKKIVLAAMEIIEFVKNSDEYVTENRPRLQIRIGVNTGAVVAGVVGTKKIAYDVWGDSVNIAARMETNSLPNRINISANTYELIKDEFNCSYRGEIEVKSKGKMKMYFIDDQKSESQSDKKGFLLSSSV